MNRIFTFFTLILVSTLSALAAEDWQSLFNGKDLTGWRANVTPEAFSVTNGTIRVNAVRESGHLFYVGDLKEGLCASRISKWKQQCAAKPIPIPAFSIHTGHVHARQSVAFGEGL
jgi:hypothetical protein